MSTCFSSLAAVLAFSSFVLVGCAGGGGEPDAEEGASTSESASDVPADGTLQAQGFTYMTGPRYYYCAKVFDPNQGWTIRVAGTTDWTRAVDVAHWMYSLRGDRTNPNGACLLIQPDTSA